MKLLTRILPIVIGPLFAVVGHDAGAQPGAAPRVVLSTSEGDITLELNAQKAPKTVENFLAYMKASHYDGTIFHRVIDGFMIQGGGFTPDLKQKPTKAPIPLESRNGLKNERGTVAMARTSVPDSATSQFFINLVDNARLDYPNPDGNGYAVFGKVVAGMDVVDKIRAVATTSTGAHQNVPAKPVLIRSARIAK
jgi:peptidyl-prolyl cis-trans isomerase A (cyclophilin A)